MDSVREKTSASFHIKTIIIFLTTDIIYELNALANEDKLRFSYFQKRVYFDQILNHYE